MIVNNGTALRKKSGAAINQYRFTKRGADSDHVIQGAAATDKTLGIVDLPGVPGTVTVAEDLTDTIIADGKVCELTLGGTVTLGDRLASDATGRGVVTTTTGDWVGAIAMEDGVVTDVIKVIKKGFTL